MDGDPDLAARRLTISAKIVVVLVSALLAGFGSVVPEARAVLVITVPSGVPAAGTTTSVNAAVAPALIPVLVHVTEPPVGGNGHLQPEPLARWYAVQTGIVSLTDTVPVALLRALLATVIV